MITRRCDLKHTPEMSPWIIPRFKVAACIVDHLHIALECRVTTAGQIIPQGPLHTFIDSIRSYRISATKSFCGQASVSAEPTCELL